MLFGGPPPPPPQKLIYAAVAFSEKKIIRMPNKNSEASDGLQKEPEGKYRGIQIISEVRRLVAGEQRPTGPGAPLGFRCQRAAVIPARKSPTILAPSTLTAFRSNRHNLLVCTTHIKSGWDSWYLGHIFAPDMFIYWSAITAKPLTGRIFAEARGCVHFRRGLWLLASV